MVYDAYYMKSLIKRIRSNEHTSKEIIKEDKPKDLSMRDLLKKTRVLQNLNEDITITDIDQEHIKNGLINSLKQLEAIPKLNPIKVINGNIFWSGSVNDMIEFVYKISPDGSKNGFKINYNDKLNIDIPDKDSISKVLEDYYTEFFTYFQNFI